LYRGGADTIGKEHFTSLYSPARARAFTKKNITAAWAATGLSPFNLERVLRATPKPPPEVSRSREVFTSARLQDEVSDMPATPVTPVTPVTTDAIVSLHNIITQDAHAIDQSSRQRPQRPVRKLASAAKISFAERALLKDQNRFSSRINSDAKARRSTKSQVLGKAKVMSYQDLEEARAKRNAKEKAVVDKATRGRKRKTLALALDVLDSPSQAIPASGADLARIPVGLVREIPGPWRAPVAQMIPKSHIGNNQDVKWFLQSADRFSHTWTYVFLLGNQM
jgi:hypothetical protein